MSHEILTTKEVIDQTKKWINDVVIGCNLCPFAANVMKQQTVRYHVETNIPFYNGLDTLVREFKRLDDDPSIETSFLIFPYSFSEFDDYLDMVSLAENLLRQERYEGVYQLATFHPLYLFKNTKHDDASNYTNRSIYPMLHILREESIDRALEHYNGPEKIPARNINFTREKGLIYMKILRDACLKA